MGLNDFNLRSFKEYSINCSIPGKKGKKKEENEIKSTDDR